MLAHSDGEFDLVVRGRRVVTPDGERPAAVAVAGGRIAGVLAVDACVRGRSEAVLAGDEVLIPGLVDTHVHVNEPGRAEWEGFATATRAAAAGGVTTIVDMPLNSLPPTVDVDALAAKRAAASEQCQVDVGFWAGAVPSNLGRLRALHDAGVSGVKCFLADSGVPEFPPLGEAELLAAMHEIAAFDGVLLVHAEDNGVLTAAAQRVAVGAGADATSYPTFLASRPAAAEDVAIARVIATSTVTGARAHVLHLSSASAVPAIAAARRDGVQITVETCPHYLALCAEEVPDGATAYKCCPPIRDRANRDGLWQALADGVIDMVVSDHSPAPTDLKQLDSGDLTAAWGGIASLQLSLSITWTEARRRGHTLGDIARWMATRPATLAGLPAKGRIAAGADADLAVFAPDEEYVVDATRLHHRHPVTPYDGMRLSGIVRRTWLRGSAVHGGEVDGAARGRLLTREGR